MLAQLEAMQTEPATSECLYGNWRLLYTDDDPSRASPFFAAFRKATKNTKVPFANMDPTGLLGESVADSIFKLTDLIPVKRIGTVRQVRKERYAIHVMYM